MLKISLHILIYLLPAICIAQKKPMPVKTAQDSRGANTQQKYMREASARFGLDSIQFCSQQWHFRLWADKQIVDIWQDEQGLFAGQITLWAKEAIPDREKREADFFYLSHKLRKSQNDTIASLISQYDIIGLPDQHAIKTWQYGADGVEYMIELAQNHQYYLKSYWSPELQDTLYPATTILHFVEAVLKTTDADSLWTSFCDEVPFQCFYIGRGPVVQCKAALRSKKKTKTQKRFSH